MAPIGRIVRRSVTSGWKRCIIDGISQTAPVRSQGDPGRFSVLAPQFSVPPAESQSIVVEYGLQSHPTRRNQTMRRLSIPIVLLAAVSLASSQAQKSQDYNLSVNVEL